jgi:hypothetical protein
MSKVKYSTYISWDLMKKLKIILDKRGQTFAGWLYSKMLEEIKNNKPLELIIFLATLYLTYYLSTLRVDLRAVREALVPWGWSSY